jgi:prevent-host-death family protein
MWRIVKDLAEGVKCHLACSLVSLHYFAPCFSDNIVLLCTNYDTSKGGEMQEQEPMTKTMKASVARQQFSQLLNDVFRRESRVLVDKSGIPVAAIISASDFKRLALLEAERNRDFAILDEMREAFKDVPLEEIEREVARAISQVRAENRTKRSPATP